MVKHLRNDKSPFGGGWEEGERDKYYQLLFPWETQENRYAVSDNPMLRQILDRFKEQQ